MIPRRREEKRKREERARGMKHMASDLETLGYYIPKLTESRAHQSASLVPLCFALLFFLLLSRFCFKCENHAIA